MATAEVGATTLATDGRISDESAGKHFPALLTLRVIMHGREAGSIIGKTGARINISDATSPERIVTVTGSLEQIVSTFRMVCCRFEEDLQQLNAALGGSEMSKHLVGLRLILPAIQCGSVIGRSGTKVKEIRDNSGASVQISGDLLPNSTERLVTISGSVDAVIKAVEMICGVILELPATMSYPQVFGALPYPALIASQQTIVALPYSALPPGTFLQPLPSSCSFPINGAPALTPGVSQSAQPTQILTIPNELIGCIIGRGGAKINEIRQQSGANIKISSSDDRTSERIIAITGTQEAVLSAIQLIEHSLEMHKATMFGSSLRHSRSSSSLGLFQQNCTQPPADADASKSPEVAMTSPSKQSESLNKLAPQMPGRHNTGDEHRAQPTTTIFQSGQAFPVNFHQSPTSVFQQNTASYMLPVTQVRPLFQPLLPQKTARVQQEGATFAEGLRGDQAPQPSGQQSFPTGALLAAGSHQQVFDPNVYHVQTSTAIQIAFRPLNPILTGAMVEPQMVDGQGGNLVLFEAPSASPDGSNCLIDPTRMLGLKSKGTGGCGGYVLTTGSRGGFKFAPY